MLEVTIFDFAILVLEDLSVQLFVVDAILLFLVEKHVFEESDSLGVLDELPKLVGILLKLECLLNELLGVCVVAFELFLEFLNLGIHVLVVFLLGLELVFVVSELAFVKVPELDDELLVIFRCFVLEKVFLQNVNLLVQSEIGPKLILDIYFFEFNKIVVELF